MSITQPLLMLVEDEPLVAVSIIELVKDMGLAIAGPFRTADVALGFLEHFRPTLAIVDYTLGISTASPIAQALRSEEIPFIVISGNRREVTDAPEFADVDWITKPFSEAKLLDCVMRCLARAKNTTEC